MRIPLLALIPGELPYDDPVDRRRAEALRGGLVVGLPGTSAFAVIYAVTGLVGVAAVHALALVPIVLAWRWLRQGHLALAAHAMCACVYVLVLSSAVATGGVFGPALIWLSVLAWLAAISRNLRGTLAWLAIIAATWVGFAAIPPLAVSDAIAPSLRSLAMVSNLGLVIVVGTLAIVAVHVADRLTVQLAAAEAVASDANADKDAFLAMMSHELRTPLTTVIGYTEALAEDGLGRSADELGDLDRIRLASRSLLAILDDILDVAHLGSSDVDLSPAPIDLDTLEAELLATVAPLADQGGNRFVIEREPLSRAPWLDGGRLRQVLVNLLGNACKFTRDGSITLRLAALPEGWIRFEVVDTGIGMTEEQQSRVFRAFEQATSTTSRDFGGTGLGLAICERLVSAMGGTLEVQSAPGRGTRFWFDIPGGGVQSAARAMSGAA